MKIQEVRGIVFAVIPDGMVSERVIRLFTEYFQHEGYDYARAEAFFASLFLLCDEEFDRYNYEDGFFCGDNWEYYHTLGEVRRYWNNWVRPLAWRMKEALWADESTDEQCHRDLLAEKTEHEVWLELAHKLLAPCHRMRLYRDEYGLTPEKAVNRKRMSRASAQKLGLC